MTLLMEKVKAGNVDVKNGVLHGVKIIGASSRNGREYPAETLRAAAPLYEGVRVNLDHRRKPDSDRPVRDTIGVLRNVAFRNGGLYGDLHIFKSHPDSAWILERAELAPDSFGLSHAAGGNVSRRGGVEVVERIEQVQSVDLVSEPATTAGLFESQERESGQHYKATNGAELAKLLKE